MGRGERFVALLMVGLGVGVAAAPVRGVDDVILNVAPGSERVVPGGTITVTLDVATLSAAINGLQALIRYDPTLMTLVDVVPTDLLLTPPNEGWVEVFREDVAGDETYAVAVNGGATSADHTVATLTFTAIAEGTTNVTFRPDTTLLFTKLTVAADNSTILPVRTDSQTIVITCDDGLFCNGVETFVGGVCQPGTNPCDDGVACTDDVCDEVADTCANTPNDANCDDLLFCTGVETCDPVLDCQPGSVPCDDGVACTDDACDEVADTCTNTPNDANCDDLLFCTGVETCDPVLDCQPGTDPCDDGVGCTDDFCDEVTDTCTSVANDANCDDLLFCTGVETCDPVFDCQPGADPCNDGVACTDDTCDEVADACANTANDANCPDDGVFCNGLEVCDPVLDCRSAGDPCVPLVCEEVGDVCVSPLKVVNLEVFYAGRYGTCVGGANDGASCSADSVCGGGVCDLSRPQADPSRNFLAAGAMATTANVVHYVGGITGLRVFFNDLADLPVPPETAFVFEWSDPPVCVGGDRDGFACSSDSECTGTPPTPDGTCSVLFSPVTGAATNITVTPTVEAGATVVSIVLADNHVRRRWLKVTIDATQVTTSGVPLDGELSGNPAGLPSGDGTPGGNAVFFLGHVPADVNDDRKTALIDIGLIRSVVNPFFTVPITNAFDVDKDGKVLLTDVGKGRLEVNPFFVLPLISP